MTPLYTATLLVTSLFPPSDYGISATPPNDVVPTPGKAEPHLGGSRIGDEPAVIYFDAPIRPYDAVIRR